MLNHPYGYEYECQDCREIFATATDLGDSPFCPSCGNGSVERDESE